MNINRIGSSDAIDLLSNLKSPMQQNKQTTLSDTDSTKSKTASDSTIRAKQNQQQSNIPALQDKQNEDDNQQLAMNEADQMVDELNEYMDELHTSLGFSVTKDPDNQVIFQIRDRNTNEVIKQIPSEEIQKIKEKMDELTGLLLDQHA